jgi:uncharacterized LabA/DUF88 family protein
MTSRYCAFIDVGHLRAQGADQLGLNRTRTNFDTGAIVAWLRGCSACTAPMLRAYWYDAAYDSRHQRHVAQRSYFDVIAATPGLQLRLGHLRDSGPNRLQRPIEQALAKTATALNINPGTVLDEFNRHWTWQPELVQKGVDTLIALDMVQMAERGTYTEAVLVAGDRDLVEAVRLAQDAGARVVIATPNRMSVAQELAQVADEVVVIDQAALQGMLVGRPVGAGLTTR